MRRRGTVSTQHLPRIGSVERADVTALLQLIDDPRGAGIADLQASLEKGRRGTIVLLDDAYGIEQQPVGVFVRRLGDPFRLLAALHDAHVVVRLSLGPPVLGDVADLLVGDEDALQPNWSRQVRRLEEHVAATDQVLGARHVEDRARVDLRGHGESDTAREVGLDQTRDDVH